jgi:competence protein ComEA
MENKNKIIFIFMIICFCVLVYNIKENSPKELNFKTFKKKIKKNIFPKKIEKKMFKIFITGAINNPGYYSYDTSINLFRVINDAGGLKQNANFDEKFYKIKFYHSDTVVIPKKINYMSMKNKIISNNTIGNLSKFVSTKKKLKKKKTKININSASLSELISLPNIGPKTAKKIIQYRNDNNGFNSIEEIMQIKRIGPKTFQNLKNLICID